MPNRRDFLKTGAIAGTGALFAKGAAREALAKTQDQQRLDNAYTLYAAATPPLTKWTEDITGISPLLAPLVPGAKDSYPGADYYEIFMDGPAVRWNFHANLPQTSPKKFTTWGYGSTYNDVSGQPAGTGFFIGYLGPTIQAQTNKPAVVKFINRLPDFHPVQQSLDPTIPEPEIYGVMPGGRVTPHLHGGFTAPQFDGHPHSWWTSGNNRAIGHQVEQGTHFASLDGVKGQNYAIYYYSNKQPATMLWYHDHAMGITRVNAYVGLAALYFIRDAYDTGIHYESALPAGALKLPGKLPSGVSYEVPLVLQDKTFNLDGSLFYPILGVTPEHPIWMPEFFGDTPVINGKCYPNLNVEARPYRFRIVNGSQARFYNLWINTILKGNLPMIQIGAEQSLLPAPYTLPGGKLLIAPGERADVIVDFSGLANGTKLIMKNDANVPYPGGGGGPAIPELMQFTITSQPALGTLNATALLALNPAGAWPTIPTLTANGPVDPITKKVTPREVAMLETAIPTGQGKQMAPSHVRLNERWFDEVRLDNATLIVDETPKITDVEEWDFTNLTVDAHPMHMHLVAFQVVHRHAFDAAAYTPLYLAWVAAGRPAATKPVPLLLGAPILPLGDEKGWKDTVKVYPGQITRVRMKFELPPDPPGSSITLPAQYVYHCHILEHEENEMMRPFLVTSDGKDPGNIQRGMWKPGDKAVASLPTEFKLEQNYPNPFNPETTLRFKLPENAHVELKIYSMLGAEVATLVDANYAAGTHSVTWNAHGCASGTYYARIKAGTFTATQKMQLVK